MKMAVVIFFKMAEKQLRKIPSDILDAIEYWILTVEDIGIEDTRKKGGNGLHDEPLKGVLKGLRSIRLNHVWRLYYKELNGIPKIISIERIDKHEY